MNRSIRSSVAVAVATLALSFGATAQQPIVLPPDGEPEPDGAIIRAAADDYRGRKPGAADVLCVIEVADAAELDTLLDAAAYRALTEG